MFAGATALGAAAYRHALVPATHPDHDHGILNIDAGGHLDVTKRDGSTRNLVGPPGRVLVLHFFSTSVPGAAAELRGFFDLQKRQKGAEVLFVAKEKDFATLDAWLKSNALEPPDPGSFVLDSTGETTGRFNAKRPLETMYFTAEGKLTAQSRGAVSFDTGAADDAVARAAQGTTIE